jgi:hypothetical protein
MSDDTRGARELVTSLRAIAWRVIQGEDVPTMEHALIKLCGQAADEITALLAQLDEYDRADDQQAKEADR